MERFPFPVSTLFARETHENECEKSRRRERSICWTTLRMQNGYTAWQSQFRWTAGRRSLSGGTCASIDHPRLTIRVSGFRLNKIDQLNLTLPKWKNGEEIGSPAVIGDLVITMKFSGAARIYSSRTRFGGAGVFAWVDQTTSLTLKTLHEFDSVTASYLSDQWLENWTLVARCACLSQHIEKK